MNQTLMTNESDPLKQSREADKVNALMISVDFCIFKWILIRLLCTLPVIGQGAFCCIKLLIQ